MCVSVCVMVCVRWGRSVGGGALELHLYIKTLNYTPPLLQLKLNIYDKLWLKPACSDTETSWNIIIVSLATEIELVRKRRLISAWQSLAKYVLG